LGITANATKKAVRLRKTTNRRKGSPVPRFACEAKRSDEAKEIQLLVIKMSNWPHDTCHARTESESVARKTFNQEKKEVVKGQRLERGNELRRRKTTEIAGESVKKEHRDEGDSGNRVQTCEKGHSTGNVTKRSNDTKFPIK